MSKTAVFFFQGKHCNRNYWVCGGGTNIRVSALTQNKGWEGEYLAKNKGFLGLNDFWKTLISQPECICLRMSFLGTCKDK